MTEVELTLMKSYQAALEKVPDFQQELIEPLLEELSNDTPNAERLADIIKLKKKSI
jgi:hypothetical protein